MQVFISWSGYVSRQIANRIDEWLTALPIGVVPFYSPNSISSGDRWSEVIDAGLNEHSFGIIIFTPENLQAPWIMFEAGALAKQVDKGRVCPILFGVTPNKFEAPIARFQAKSFEEAEMLQFVKDLAVAAGYSGLQGVQNAFKLSWKEVERGIREEMAKLPPPDASEKTPDEPSEQVLHHIRDVERSIQVLDTRVQEYQGHIRELSKLNQSGLPITSIKLLTGRDLEIFLDPITRRYTVLIDEMSITSSDVTKLPHLIENILKRSLTTDEIIAMSKYALKI